MTERKHVLCRGISLHFLAFPCVSRRFLAFLGTPGILGISWIGSHWLAFRAWHAASKPACKPIFHNWIYGIYASALPSKLNCVRSAQYDVYVSAQVHSISFIRSTPIPNTGADPILCKELLQTGDSTQGSP